MLNRITIMGRLTRDPDLRYTQSNIPVASFSLAVERDFKDKQTGEKVTDFFDVVAWRNTGEFVDKYFSKGRMAIIEGKLQTRSWNDRDGNKRKSIEIIAENVYFGDSKRDDDGYRKESYSAGRNTAQPQRDYPPSNYDDSDQFTELEDDDGDLPF